ncbi:HutD family protein [Arthrobacter gengyunqii]|uniref:HutD family protein n=1 Tax=Arthrobacter gengyunqii TaxID=2886940 RepID=A0A9X1LZE8_9MICC|nr:HutD family protein [Arthrobacter gengyunqii]MCC3265721.1 HutD family protein [Arthrobacter gengyunqii]MCC3268458.1 HutD family protein [Arthrobacter gengyunqii]UOY95851.1 HutD family protein [Arthrobacter gengyunqii]
MTSTANTAAPIIRFPELPSAPWGNNNGRVKDIASGTGWRLSVASVDKPGAFTAFPGMDRITVPVEGELLVLTVDGAEHGMEKFRPFRYSGDVPAEAALPTGPVTVLNTFVDRNTTGAAVMVVELSKKNPQTLGPGQLLVLLHGSATATAAGGSATALEPLDTVVGADERPAVLGRGYAAVVSFYDLD